MNKKTFIICAMISTPNMAKQFKENLSTHVAEKYVEVMDNVFVIRSRFASDTCEIIRDRLTFSMSNIMLFIMETSQHAAWRLPLLTSNELDKIL